MTPASNPWCACGLVAVLWDIMAPRRGRMPCGGFFPRPPETRTFLTEWAVVGSRIAVPAGTPELNDAQQAHPTAPRGGPFAANHPV